MSQERDRLQNLQLVIGQVETFVKMVEGSLKEADFSTKRQVIRSLVKHLESTDFHRVSSCTYSYSFGSGYIDAALQEFRKA